MDKPVDAWRILVDPRAAAGDSPTLRLPAEATGSDAARAIEGLMRRDLDVEVIRVVVGERVVGSTTRSYLSVAFGLDRSTGGVGTGDGATLPGESTRFVLVRYECRAAGCDTREYRVVHDERALPECPSCGQRMDLVW